ncbi:wD repeat domain [Linnemannia zychae]|nr:wD repeat domain [Linnemannia zychae]
MTDDNKITYHQADEIEEMEGMSDGSDEDRDLGDSDTDGWQKDEFDSSDIDPESDGEYVLARSLRTSDIDLESDSEYVLPRSIKPLSARIRKALDKIRSERLNEHEEKVYIPLWAKSSRLDSDDKDFLMSGSKVMLLLGDSGGGKSTFLGELEHSLWRKYKEGDRIPLLIRLANHDKPEEELIDKHLKSYGFNKKDISQMRERCVFTLLCDGYDESKCKNNLYKSNRLNDSSSSWDAKMIITCRSTYLTQDYQHRFQPFSGSHYIPLPTNLFQEAVIVPFLTVDIKKYVTKYVAIEKTVWNASDYMTKLSEIPGLLDLSKNPFHLWMALVTLPRLDERAQQNLRFKARLHKIIQDSKSPGYTSIAASNAITILVRARVRFNGEDLRSVKIQGADLSGGCFDNANFKNADLTEVIFSSAWLRQVNFKGAILSNIQFGEGRDLEENAAVLCCLYSPNGEYLVAGLDTGKIEVYDTKNWYKSSRAFTAHKKPVRSVAFSPKGRRLLSACEDATIRLWTFSSRETFLVMEGHVGAVLDAVFSPCGNIIASAGDDGSVRLWDAKTGNMNNVLRGHHGPVTCVAFSPNGCHLASGSEDAAFLWNPKAGKKTLELGDGAFTVAFSPTGDQLALGVEDGQIQIVSAATATTSIQSRALRVDCRLLSVVRTKLFDYGPSIAASPEPPPTATGALYHT